ncbi:GNAT family N-acetyltransferase [Bacillus weihaiensis]|uniref:GNAT family acetyltransferase n=1 Tax=Bacillus weihaiensis TaxID=1547283 RepID=A0A1L3MTL5_9BACI|nr:GNAT family N-acetyltransferase [Bacillus weihaiensis]APH05644.1 GNAT family acetyltransferase [Bacillus weihaiensis]
MKIRSAQLKDVEAISDVHIKSWKQTYTEIVPEKYLSTLSIEEKRQLWTRVIPNGGVYVVQDDHGDVIGFASGGKERTGTYEKYEGELYAIYLLKQYQGRGIGKKLFQVVVNDLKTKEIQSLVVWVIAENSSRLFYEKMEGVPIDKKEIDIGGVLVEEIAFGWTSLK